MKKWLLVVLSGFFAGTIAGDSTTRYFPEYSLDPEGKVRTTPYISVGAGAGFINDSDVLKWSGGGFSSFEAKFKTGYLIELAGGLIFQENRTQAGIEVEGIWQSNDLADGLTTLNQANCMLNVFYGYEMGVFTPYALLGGGVAWLQFDASSGVSDDSMQWAAQGGFGVKYKLTEKMDIDLGYRYYGTASGTFIDAGTVYTLYMEGHRITAGIEFHF